MPKREYNIINELCNKTGIKHYLREKRTVIQHDLVNIHIVIPIYVALVTCGIDSCRHKGCESNSEIAWMPVLYVASNLYADVAVIQTTR